MKTYTVFFFNLKESFEIQKQCRLCEITFWTVFVVSANRITQSQFSHCSYLCFKNHKLMLFHCPELTGCRNYCGLEPIKNKTNLIFSYKHLVHFSHEFKERVGNFSKASTATYPEVQMQSGCSGQLLETSFNFWIM